MMNPQGDGCFVPGRASNRPPLFCGINLAHQSSLMQMFIIDHDLEILDIIRKGPRKPMTERDGIRVLKCENYHTQCHVQKNYKAIKFL